MPLSDHEQRILAELEKSLHLADPEFAEKVRSESVYRHAGRRAKWAALTFLLGLAVLVIFFTQSIWLGLFGVAVMFASGVVVQRSLGRMGRASWQDLTRGLQSDGPSGAAGLERNVHDAKDWFRRRFRGDH